MEIHFDVNSIVSITCRNERPTKQYNWRYSKPITYLFGLIRTGKYTKSGYYFNNIFSNNAVVVSEQDIRNNGFKLYPRSERLIENVVYYASATITLLNGQEIFKEFDTEDQMRNWVEDVINTSNKTFVVLNK